jgi:hypothetical protein
MAHQLERVRPRHLLHFLESLLKARPIILPLAAFFALAAQLIHHFAVYFSCRPGWLTVFGPRTQRANAAAKQAHFGPDALDSAADFVRVGDVVARLSLCKGSIAGLRYQTAGEAASLGSAQWTWQRLA